MLNSLEAVLFDLDGVIVDSRAPIARCINYALQRAGLAPEREPLLHARIGDPLHGVFAALLADRGADPARAPECVVAYRERYREVSLTDTTLVPGIAELLAALAARRPLALATSKPVEFAVPILERLGVAGHFAPTWARRSSRARPRPRPTRRAARSPRSASRRARARRWSAIDTTTCRPRAALRIGAIGVTWGIGSEAELREAGAEWLVASPAELAASSREGALSLARARAAGCVGPGWGCSPLSGHPCPVRCLVLRRDRMAPRGPHGASRRRHPHPGPTNDSPSKKKKSVEVHFSNVGNLGALLRPPTSRSLDLARSTTSQRLVARQ